MPLLLIVAALVATDGGPVFFRHKRVGRSGTHFGCLKFRTMIPDAEHTLVEYLQHHEEAADEWRKHQKLTFDPRITTIGKALRASSIDEIPQLINVLRGEMSLVGPRPVTLEELSRYGADAEHYKAVLPGITGLWQVNGRNSLTYEQRIEFDVEYVKRWSLLLDMSILFRTPWVVFSREGAQ
jgi:lipopolysaccharide/colanic/teichoic acid biosynthesis glycosyltransferase